MQQGVRPGSPCAPGTEHGRHPVRDR